MSLEEFNEDDESNHLINVNIYDSHSSFSILRVNNTAKASDICGAIAYKNDLCLDDAKFHSLVLVITVFNVDNRGNVHCVRTLSQNECVLDIRGILISKLLDKYNICDSKEIINSVRWFYKDIRTSPIDLGDAGDVCGEYSSDEEEEISHSDLAYLAKAERKGYLLKRSSKDQNLWRRWYCALTDHMWCVDINRDDPRAICIKLSGMIRYKQGNCMDKTDTTLQTIIINSLKRTHFFRAFNVNEHCKWIEDLNIKTNFAADNDYFSMAEVIICDEENSRIKRMHRHMDGLMDSSIFFESFPSKNVSTDLEISTEIKGFGCVVPSDKPISNLVTAVDDLIDEEELYSSTSMLIAEADLMLDPSEIINRMVSSSSSDVREKSGRKDRENIDFFFNPLNRCVRSSTLHSLHGQNGGFFHALRFIVEVAYYREMYRHDLTVTDLEQYNCAAAIFKEYLLPQSVQMEINASYNDGVGQYSNELCDAYAKHWHLTKYQIDSVRERIFLDNCKERKLGGQTDNSYSEFGDVNNVEHSEQKSVVGLSTFWTTWYVHSTVNKLVEVDKKSGKQRHDEDFSPCKTLSPDLFDEVVNHLTNEYRL